MTAQGGHTSALVNTHLRGLRVQLRPPHLPCCHDRPWCNPGLDGHGGPMPLAGPAGAAHLARPVGVPWAGGGWAALLLHGAGAAPGLLLWQAYYDRTRRTRLCQAGKAQGLQAFRCHAFSTRAGLPAR